MKKKENLQAYSAAAAKGITGATQRQLDYWDCIELIQPSIQPAQGKGSNRLYSYHDLVQLQVVVTLRETQVPLQRIRKALRILQQFEPDSNALLAKRIISDGNDIFVTTSDRRVLKSVLKRGQLAFSVVFLGDVIKEANRRIELYKAKQMTG